MPLIEAYVRLGCEVYCANCGFGLCDGTTVKKRNELHVALCPQCKGELQAQIDELEERIAGLQMQKEENE